MPTPLMNSMLIQVYEIGNPAEAVKVAGAGVHHIGVLVPIPFWQSTDNLPDLDFTISSKPYGTLFAHVRQAEKKLER